VWTTFCFYQCIGFLSYTCALVFWFHYCAVFIFICVFTASAETHFYLLAPIFSAEFHIFKSAQVSASIFFSLFYLLHFSLCVFPYIICRSLSFSLFLERHWSVNDFTAVCLLVGTDCGGFSSPSAFSVRDIWEALPLAQCSQDLWKLVMSRVHWYWHSAIHRKEITTFNIRKNISRVWNILRDVRESSGWDLQTIAAAV